jgi:uncharacterized membrane protein SpoIIM required for sporulation
MGVSRVAIIETQLGPHSQGILARVRWNLSRALIIARREVVDMFRDWRIIVPIVLLTLIFPGIANWGAGEMIDWVGRYGADIVGERLIPFLLLVVGFFPISFSLIIALETFVGEKERRSLEPLLSTPLSDLQVYIGKMLSSTVPPTVGSLLGITVYLIGVYLSINWQPPFWMLVQVLLLTTLQAVVMVAGAVVVSSQVTSVRAANLLASFIIIPMAFLIQAEALIMFWARYNVLWWILLGLLVIAVVLVRMGVRNFNRESLLGGEIDDLNLPRGIKNLWRLVLARNDDTPHSAWAWYRDEVLAVVWQVRGAIVLIIIAMLAGYAIGYRYTEVYPLPSVVFNTGDWSRRFSAMLELSGLQGGSGVLLVLGQNVRALAIASVLATFSFGAMAVLILMLPTGILGFLMGQMSAAGLAPAVLLATVLPHSLIEIPAAIIAGAVAVRLGASVITPPPGRTVGQGWMLALADAVRLWFLLILPLLLVASIAEIYLTPAIVRMLA